MHSSRPSSASARPGAPQTSSRPSPSRSSKKRCAAKSSGRAPLLRRPGGAGSGAGLGRAGQDAQQPALERERASRRAPDQLPTQPLQVVEEAVRGEVLRPRVDRAAPLEQPPAVRQAGDQFAHIGFGQGQHMPFGFRLEVEAVHGAGGGDQQGRSAEAQHARLHPHAPASRRDEQQVVQVPVGVRADRPIGRAAAGGDRLQVHEARIGLAHGLAVEEEGGNGGGGHGALGRARALPPLRNIQPFRRAVHPRRSADAALLWGKASTPP